MGKKTLIQDEIGEVEDTKDLKQYKEDEDKIVKIQANIRG